ncbi:BQ2448_3589 [Microbotryum intermedium]|uniref:BQ2448_3589 protein n=1 Tax=Microbotryum intermedium TaxID=269621 RepID=A0A238FCB9_9BASI|nr:BQ2448_3589 [Microbotryum intermedium]
MYPDLQTPHSMPPTPLLSSLTEEFSIEIPDEDADRITTVGEAIDYISKSPEAH